MMTAPAILGIETSCDETAAAVVTADGRILSNAVLSQLDDHAPFGGVVPEVAARAHLHQLDAIVTRALDEAGCSLASLAGIAATAGPGLIGGLLVGTMTGRGLAFGSGVPFWGINHLEGHALTPRLAPGRAMPYVLLLVSGGHCEVVLVRDVGDYARLGGTLDDAAGEAFDKTAKLLGLGYPGGPAIEAAAVDGDPQRFPLPRPMVGKADCRMSFSGLKTAVRRHVDKLGGPEALTVADRCDLAAGFQAAVATVLADRAHQALAQTGDAAPGAALVAAGGVAANTAVRTALTATAEACGRGFVAPPLALCTDQGAMIAWAAQERRARGWTQPVPPPPRPRWSLADLAAVETPDPAR